MLQGCGSNDPNGRNISLMVRDITLMVSELRVVLLLVFDPGSLPSIKNPHG